MWVKNFQPQNTGANCHRLLLFFLTNNLTVIAYDLRMRKKRKGVFKPCAYLGEFKLSSYILFRRGYIDS